jgi:hypothetical protein
MKRNRAESGTNSERPKGGQGLPDSVQDRPEQNEGYDRAVRGDTRVRPARADIFTQEQQVPLDDDLTGEDVQTRDQS